MPTYIGGNYTTPNVNQTFTNTDFQNWCTQMRNALLGAGLIQTADTGQLDPTTATYPAAQSDGGYWIFRFDDTRQGVDPIFLRIMPGRGISNSSGYLRLRVQIGQGSNGSGTITGQNNTYTIGDAAPSVTTGTSTVYDMATHSDGHAALITRYGHNDFRTYNFAFSVSRTRDAGGAFDSKGVFFWYAGGTQSLGVYTNSRMAAIRFASPATNYTDNLSYCIIPGQPANTALLNGDKQLYPHFLNFPEVTQAWATFTVRGSEFPATPTTFLAAPYAGVSRTFISLGFAGQGIRAGNVTNDLNFTPVLLWEE